MALSNVEQEISQMLILVFFSQIFTIFTFGTQTVKKTIIIKQFKNVQGESTVFLYLLSYTK